jgi:hypothetical protein
MTINRRGKKNKCNFIMPIHVLNAEKISREASNTLILIFNSKALKATL